MNVLFISNDPSIFREGSAARARMRAYADAFGTLYVVSRAPRNAREVIEGSFSLHPVCARSPFHFWALARAAHRLAKRAHIDVISAQDPFEYGYLAWKARFFTAAKLHIQLHTDPFASGFAHASLANRLRRILMPFILARADRIRVVTPRLKEEIERRYRPRAKVAVLPIYADLARFRGVCRAPIPDRLVWVGRLEQEKDPMLALETLAAARAVGIEATLIMVGTGSLQKALLARAKARGLLPYFTLTGHVDPLPYLEEAALVLATSHYEGYGLAILEALAASVPVLATDVGVAREAGATIASRESFISTAVALLKEGPPVPPTVADPYPSFEAYVEAYAKDLAACLA